VSQCKLFGKKGFADGYVPRLPHKSASRGFGAARRTSVLDVIIILLFQVLKTVRALSGPIA
jgi:hypothetical protein